MNDSETRRYEMFLRVREFGTMNASHFPAGTLAADLFTRLQNTIAALDDHTTAQSSGIRAAQESSTSKAAARDDLRRDLEAIARTARSMAFTTPGMEDRFRAPRSISEQALLSLARSFAADAAPLKAEFIRRGLAANFLEDLNSDIDVFESAITRRIQSRETHVTATAGIDELIDEGVDVVRELGPVIRNIFSDEPSTLAAWLSASHVQRVDSPNRPPAPNSNGGTTPAENK